MKLTIQGLLAQTAAHYRDQSAVECGCKSLTYQEVEEQSDAIACYLLASGLQKGAIVGVFLEDRINLIVAILGILKAGAVFVPFDLTYPTARLETMLLSIDYRLVIVDERSIETVRKIISHEASDTLVLFSRLFGVEEDIPFPISEPNDPVYIYFTSGSTGSPKGIIGRYKGLLHFIKWELESFPFPERVRVSQFSSPAFDAFLRDLFVPLCSGGTVCIPENREILLDSAQLVQWIDRAKVNLIHCVPSLFRVFNSRALQVEMFRELRYVLLSGERINPASLSNWYKTFGKRIQLVNLYGPTETTMVKTFYLIQEEDQDKRSIPVGKAQKGAAIFILDEELNLCNPGTVGEVFIRTPYMTLGYYNDPDLTAEKFIPNPFTDDPTDLIYRTGDLGRMDLDGQLEIIGRNDHQVKIRGVRVEPGEIENQILTCPGVKETVVVDQEDEEGNPFLVAYIVIEADASELDLRGYLSQSLPEQMIPNYLIKLEKLPLLPNGKVDRKALPKPEAVLTVRPPYVAPRNEIETKLAQIWSKVLGIQEVGIDDHFFDLGGHSLKATSVVAQIFKEMKVDVPLREIFRYPTLAELALYIAKAERRMYVSIERAPVLEYYPLSSAQKRMYMLYQLNRESTGYNLPGVLQIEGELDLDRMELAFNELIQRHPSLRTSFHEVGGEVVQRIHAEVRLKVAHWDATEQEVAGIIRDFVQPFNLSEGVLFRIGVVQCQSNYILLYDLHHIIADRISLNILVHDFVKLYAGEEIPELHIQYTDYAVWQEQFLQSEQFKKLEEYWLKRFGGELPVLNLPLDEPRPAVMRFVGQLVQFELDASVTDRLKMLAHREGATLYMALLAIYNLLLARYTGQDDILVGSPIAGRPHADLEGIIGMFVNTLVMRNQPLEKLTFQEFLSEVQETVLQAFEHQDYQFELLVDKLAHSRDLSRNPIFDTMFVLQNTDTVRLEVAGLVVSPYEFVNEKAHFDLTLGAAEVEDKIHFALEYRVDLFKPETIAQMAQHFIQIAREVTENPEVRLGELQMLTLAEREQILFAFNATQTKYLNDQTIPGIFLQQVAREPEQIAVVFEGKELSYRDLDQRAGQVAAMLIARGLQPDQLVGIMVERSLEMVIGVMGILKAGGAYVPIDSEYPDERIRYIITDSGLVHLVVSEKVANEKLSAITSSDLSVVTMEEAATQLAQVTLYPILRPDHLAYVIYTSGSTGLPKGVMVEQKSVINLATWFNRQYNLHENRRVLQMTSISFDVAVEEILVSLLNGATVYIPRRETVMSRENFSKFIDEHGIQIVQFVPVTLREFLLVEENHPDLRVIICGGERLDDLLKDAVLAKGYELYNHYGPTETTVDALTGKCSNAKVNLGQPIDNTRVYILGNSNMLQPVGVVGELWIGGEGIARGYLNRPQLTMEKFVPDPFVPGERMYRTGDLARWLPDGSVEFIGRKDEQVKIRGLRIEPGEIETTILRHPQVSQAAVIDIAGRDGNKELGAYLVSVEFLIRLEGDENDYYIVTTEQNPSLKETMEELHMNLWPDFFVGDEVNVRYWPQVYDVFPDYQMAIMDSAGNVLAAANTVPLAWDGSSEDLPSGWDASMERAFQNWQRNEPVNSLCAVAATVNTKFTNKGLSYLIIKAMNIMAVTQGLEHAIYPVRPTLKEKYADADLFEYSQRRREDGLLFDPWLRVHERLKAEVIGYAPESQRISGTVEQWEIWTGQVFSVSGEYVVKGSMQPVQIELEKNVGVYYDQAVWMEHDLTPFRAGNTLLTLKELRDHLAAFLPDFMIPTHFVFLPELPLTQSGKVDRKALLKLEHNCRAGIEYTHPTNWMEEKLLAIWSELLGREEIGIDDNFFTLGGHSLKATSLVSQVYKTFHVELPLRTIFKMPTIRMLAQYIGEAKGAIYRSIKKVEKQDTYPASSAQKRLYMVHHLNSEDTRYNISSLLTVEGELDQNRFERAIQKLLSRHESLRTSFAFVEGEVVQIVHEDVEFSVSYSSVPETELANTIEELIRPFALSQPPLFRVGLIESAGKYLVVLDLHHIIADGVSLHILTSELVQLYQGNVFPDLHIQYRDFAVWQNELFQSKAFQRQEEYWLKRFAGTIPLLNLPTDYPRPVEMKYCGERLSFTLDAKDTEKVQQLALEQSATLHMVLLAAYNVLLYRYTSQEDIIVGSPIAGRPHADLEMLVGIFVNILAMRNKPTGEKRFGEFLREVKENALQAYEHQDYQFEMLVKKLDLARDLTRNPLFDTMFVLQNTGTMELSLPDLHFKPVPRESKKVKFDLNLTAVEANGELRFMLDYNTSLFARATVERMKEHFLNILRAIPLSFNEPLLWINMLSESEREELIWGFNKTKRAFPAEKTLAQIFVEQVVKTPDQIALMEQERRVTYAELDLWTEELAGELMTRGVRPGTIVGLMAERSVEMMVGILGILKAGGVYLPIDPEYPVERIQYMVNDSGAELVLTNVSVEDGFMGREVLDLREFVLYHRNVVGSSRPAHATDLAYLLYTSGSTGRPKGVLVEHCSVVNTLSHLQQRYPLGGGDILLQSTTITFDASVREIFWWFFNGATCYLLSGEEAKDPRAIVGVIEKHQITCAKFAPVMLNEIVIAASEMGREKLYSIRSLFVGGEALTQQLVDNVLRVCPGLDVFCNLYGPTECTIHCTEYLVTEPILTKLAPIGKPISNDRIYILNQALQPEPIGVIGEIYVAGVGVARAYLHQDELTAECFLDDPFVPGERMYRTGDLGRWLPDRNVAFCGRRDQQVKIRGFRIELGEIENQLLKHGAVKKAVVAVKQSLQGDGLICAYLELSKEEPVEEIQSYLKTMLPDYMLPHRYVILDQLPLTASGKLDRKALPEPEVSQDKEAYLAARNEVEARLAKIWSEVLERERIGVRDHFFQLGGHSMKAALLTARIAKEFQLQVPLREIFVNPTIEQLAERMALLEQYHTSFTKPITLLNEQREKKLFCFPPLIGHGVAYRNFAALLDEFSVYAFDFIEEEDRLEKYVEYMVEIQGTGPYILMGYSAGGNLAFEVAKVMVARGYEVEKVILLDTMRRNGASRRTMRQLEETVDQLLDQPMPDPVFREYLSVGAIKRTLRAKMLTYLQYLEGSVNTGQIFAPICLIKASEAEEVDYGWQGVGEEVSEFVGSGTHREMLDGENLEKNAALVKWVLWEVVGDKV